MENLKIVDRFGKVVYSLNNSQNKAVFRALKALEV